MSPVIPAITQPCPAWQDGAVTFMGLPGIRLAVGPKPAGPTAPMLVYWHGTNSPSDEYLRLAAPVADGIIKAGGVIVSFEGTTGGDALSATNIFGKGDLVIVDQLVSCAIRDHNVDPLRIYTTGCSAGGFFATAMAALRSQYVAAAAPNSGGKGVDLMFADNHTPALMTIHPPTGSLDLVDLEKTSHDADKMFKARGGFAIDCHLESGVCNNALAGDVWTFFLAHPFGAPPDPWAGGLPGGFSDKCQIQ
jgi:hypothetical protein